MRKYKTAGKIKAINKIKNQDESTSHLVNYFKVVNEKGMAPKGLGMIHRKDDVDQINLRGLNLDGIHLEAFAISVSRAKYVTKIILKDCGLSDKEGLRIITNMNKKLVKHLDFSENSTLSADFYEQLGEIYLEPETVLERIEIEDNRVGDSIIIDFVD